jgi:hypothetical protein
MKASEVEQLLQKYLAGETSLAEEKRLAAFFRKADVPAHLRGYAEQFGYYIGVEAQHLPEELCEDRLFGKIDFTEQTTRRVPVQQPVARSLGWGRSIAASVAFLVLGFAAGQWYASWREPFPHREMVALRRDVQQMKQLVMLTMLEKQSPSERLKAVDFAQAFAEPDAKVVSALVRTLNSDANVNVRLAAANALARFARHRPVRDALMESLSHQSDPIVQISLINLMVDLAEKRAVVPLRQLLQDPNTSEVVREEVKKSLGALL